MKAGIGFMRVLLTGAAGFIGFHLSRRLMKAGIAVVGSDNLNDYYDPALKRSRLGLLEPSAEFAFFHGDVSSRSDVAGMFGRGPYDAVIHLAAQAGVRYSLDHPEAYVQSNLVGFGNILEACRRHQVAHLLFASSSSVYGLNSVAPFRTDQNVDHPVSLYAATKKANELMAHSYSHLFRLPVTGLRFFTVYGPWGRPDMAYFKFTEAILAGRPIEVFNSGELWRDFTFVDDIVESVARLVSRPAKPDPTWSAASPNPATSSAPYRVYNIGSQSPIKVLDFIRSLERVIGKRAELCMLPMQPGDVVATHADTSDLEKETGFTPSTNLETGLTRFVEWYRSYYRR
jgi:UDP-glucuronate 4-epimerase